MVGPMSLGKLKVMLESDVPPIQSPNRALEQYTTPPEIALAMTSWAREAGLLEGSVVVDLGAGTCRIAIAALLLGASRAVAVDLDERLAKPCLEAGRKLGVSGRLSYVVGRVSQAVGPLRQGAYDLVLTNPPFGVWRRGADREFLVYAMSLRPKAIIAVVKSGNLDFHGRLARMGNYELKLIGEFGFPIPASMPHHRSRIRRVKVDLIELSGI
ncbi:MAG: METTL5 family protein [Acidilobus sp.]